MKKIINNIFRHTQKQSTVVVFVVSALISLCVIPQTASAGWITSNIFGGGNDFTDNILGIDPPDHDEESVTARPPRPPRPIDVALTGTCSVNPSSVSVGGYLNWSISAVGGNGSYTYYWTGTDGLSANSPSISKAYVTCGTKSGIVTMPSG